MTVKLSWHPKEFNEIVRIIEEVALSIKTEIAEMISVIGMLSCPSPLSNSDGNYHVIIEGEDIIIQKMKTDKKW